MLLPSGAFAIEFPPIESDSALSLDPAFFAQLQRLVRPATLDIGAGRIMKGISGLEQARALMAATESRNWPGWLYVNKPYGLALIQLEKYQDAIDPLEIALQVENRLKSSNSEKIRLLRRSLDEGIVKQLLKAEYARQALSNVETNGQVPHTIIELLLDQSTGTMDTAELLLRAYAMSGNIAEAAAILEPEVQAAKENQSAKELPRVALEYRLLKMGAALSRAGDKSNAARAFNAALDLNFYRLRTVGDHVYSPDIQLAIYSVRRLMLSAALGNIEFQSLTKPATKELLLKVLETKGLGIRYAEHFSHLLETLKSANAEAARTQLAAIENRMAEIPAGSKGLLQYFQLSADKWSAVAPVMPELRARGLGDVFQDGESLLSQASKGSDGAAMIGYMAYTPLASDKFEFAASRYLRFCVIGNEMQLADVGLKTKIDRAVFKWRQLVLTGQPVSQQGAALSQLLLSNLPDSVQAAQMWTIEPDGALNLVPFEALPDSSVVPLILSKNIGYVTSIGQLGKSAADGGKKKARIIADPDFGPPLRPKSPTPCVETRATANSTLSRRSIESMEIAPLPDTRIEAVAVEKALRKLGVKSDSFLGGRADVHAFEMSESPQFFHIATHGILIESPRLSEQSQIDSLGQAESINMALPGRNAGLAVAGVGKPEIVYANELARLPLNGTELVVLSACDTGNGAIDVGEGIASLRRSIETAGARASVTSLWSVPSIETTKLMSSFYDYLASGLSKREALQRAKQDSISRNPNPYNWAGFVFSGQE